MKLKEFLAQIRVVTYTALTIFLSATQADDTEIYVGQSQSAAKPNVLFIFDTSTSMRATGGTVGGGAPYDPSTIYSVPSGQSECIAGQIYYEEDDPNPECDSEHFSPDKLVCSGARVALDLDGNTGGPGVFGDKFAGWRQRRNASNSYWSTSSRFENSNRRYIECKQDHGIHGLSDSSSAKNLANGSDGPWTTSTTSWPAGNRDFWLYTPNYVHWFLYHQQSGSTLTRMEVVKVVAQQLADSMTGINVGLMRFEYNLGNTRGGPVIFAMQDIDADGVRDAFKASIGSLRTDSHTRLAETMYEAGLYYRNQAPKFGLNEGDESVSDSLVDGRYKSPIDNECGHNYILLLTDGRATSPDVKADSEINALLTLGATDYTSCSGNCLDEMAGFLHEADNATAALGNDQDGPQNVITYTIGFYVDDGILSDTAQKGGGVYHTASSAQQLTTAFLQFLGAVLDTSDTFVSPAVSVNAFNRLTHRNELYFTVFRPSDRTHWNGNVKRFALGLIDGELAILDANNNNAINSETGLFADTALSYWTPSGNGLDPDGPDVEKGGLASRLFDYNHPQYDATSRQSKVYTYTGSIDTNSVVISDLTNAVNRVHENNGLTDNQAEGRITKAMTGAGTYPDAEFISLLKWSRGVDVNDEDDDNSTTDGRPIIGAPLHTQPKIVTYSVDNTNDRQLNIMFAMTNDGFLHALNTTDPASSTASSTLPRIENWTFIPPENLTNLKSLYENDLADTISYGLDGGIDVWVKDLNDNGVVLDSSGNLETGEHVKLFFGQRRGGRSYYALDTSDYTTPRFLWSINGDTVAQSSPFSLLGQTWSMPRHHQINVRTNNGGVASLEAKDILIFGGGYDTGQDSANTSRGTNDLGNAIYIVDADSGNLLWWAGKGANGVDAPSLSLSNMEYAIPANIKIVDINGDDIADSFFTSDTGGQIWRFDIDNKTIDTLSNRITGGVIADLQKTSANSSAPDEANNRRFYYPPDIALIEPTGSPYLSVSIGSGYRAHPNDTTIQDRLYVIKDKNVSSPPTDNSGNISYNKLHQSDFLDVTSILETNNLSVSDQEKLSNGWFISLQSGEKSLAQTITVEGIVFFTTFKPPADNGAGNGNAVCGPGQGTGRTYALNVINGNPVANLDSLGGNDSSDLIIRDRYYELTAKGIPSDVTIVFPDLEGIKPKALVGTEILPVEFDNPPVATYWYQDNVH